MATTQKAKAKGRKIGNKIKKSAQVRYVKENRAEKNKYRNIEKEKKRQKRLRERAVQHGGTEKE